MAAQASKDIQPSSEQQTDASQQGMSVSVSDETARVGANQVDRDLIVRLLAGDEDAFVELVGRHNEALVRLARWFVSDPEVAVEVVQETWLAVLRGLPSFEGRSTLKTWIFKILTNRAKSRALMEGRTLPFSALRRRHDESDRGQLDPSELHWSSGKTAPRSWDAQTPEKRILDQEARLVVEAVIEQLPAKQRAVVSFRDLEGWSSVEVCEALEISEIYQRVLLHRGRAKVRKVLTRYLGET